MHDICESTPNHILLKSRCPIKFIIRLKGPLICVQFCLDTSSYIMSLEEAEYFNGKDPQQSIDRYMVNS